MKPRNTARQGTTSKCGGLLAMAGIALAVLALQPCSAGSSTPAQPDPPAGIAPVEAPFPMPQLQRPVFPARTVSIVDHGAVGDGLTDNTAAIRRAIAACHEGGGGRVLVPAGKWLTGPIRLKSDINLHFEEGAEVHFSDDPAAYLPLVFTRWSGFEVMNRSPLIYADGCNNIAVTGPGRLFGHGRKWWHWQKRIKARIGPMLDEMAERGVPPSERIFDDPEFVLRPQFISPVNCRNVLLEGFTIAEPGPFWTIHLVYCENVIVRGLSLHTRGGPNTDGINLDSTRNALVEHCLLDVGDDAVCLKSGINEDGRRVGRPTENIVVRHVTARACHGGIVIGSDMSGGVRNVFAHDCVFDGSDCGIRLKSNADRGGLVENLTYRSITMRNIRSEALRINTNYGAWGAADKGASFYPLFRHITLDDITCAGAGRAVSVRGAKAARMIEDLTLRRVSIKAGKGMHFSHVDGLRLLDVTCEAASGEPRVFDRCSGVVEDPVSPRTMMTRYLLHHARMAWHDWQARFENIRTPEEIAAYQQRMREVFLAELGGFPERTPLNAKTTGTLRRPGYRVEKVLFESRPGFHVTGALFVPESDDWQAPFPGVLVPCGHTENGKAHGDYQAMGALLALNGMVALVFDPVDQGERMQLVNDQGRYPMWGTKGHTMAGVGAIPLGLNTATYEIWDGMRAIDYLQARPEVDADRIGCTGNSGGGTQTSMLMALDGRITAAAPSCYFHTLNRQLESPVGDAEQNIHRQLAAGLEHPDFIMMRAPRPVLICAASRDFFDIDAVWESFRYAKRRYTDLGHAEKVAILENAAGHNYNRTQREGAVRWMARWLQGRVADITEPEIALFPDRELRCTPRGQVMLLPGARSIYDLNAEFEETLARQRAARLAKTTPRELRAEVRAIAGIRQLDALPAPRVEMGAPRSVDKGASRPLTIHPEAGIFLPAVLHEPAGDKRPAVLLLHENGKDAVAGEAARLMRAGHPVLTVDLRGTGATFPLPQTKFGEAIGNDWQDYFRAYVLGRSYVGMRAEDILVCARWLARHCGSEAVAVRATGHAGVPALHAAALEPDLVRELHLDDTLASWREVVSRGPTHNQLITTVHGALRVYDLPDLAALLGKRLTTDSDPTQSTNPPPLPPDP